MTLIPERFIPSNYQQCTRTVMDNITDPNIRFDKDGISNYALEYEADKPAYLKDPVLAKQLLDNLLVQIKKEGKGKPYDCLIGVSGGVDSTYVALLVKKLNLRPLVVHFDNGWNSELAVKNIENIISKTGFDLYTHVFDWEQFKAIQLSHFKADVIDIEGISDIAIWGTLMQLAVKYKIKYILNGNNYLTEKILPTDWTFKDYYNIIDIHKKMGGGKIDLFPYLDNTLEHLKARMIGIQSVSILDYIDYNKVQAKQDIQQQMGWTDYGGKHYESIFTRFYQGYILPKKFGVDKRKAHLSTLICSQQLSKAEALEELKKDNYNTEQLAVDYEFVLKKLGYTDASFQAYIQTPRVRHEEFDTTAKALKRNVLKSFIKKML